MIFPSHCKDDEDDDDDDSNSGLEVSSLFSFSVHPVLHDPQKHDTLSLETDFFKRRLSFWV